MTLLQLIEKWKLNRAMLAGKMKMTKDNFNKKLNPDYYGNLTESENEGLINILNQIKTDIEKYLKNNS